MPGLAARARELVTLAAWPLLEAAGADRSPGGADLGAARATPRRYPEWAGDAIEVTGVPTEIEKGSTFEQTGPGPFGGEMTTDLRGRGARRPARDQAALPASGYYSHWRLTEAQGQTFADVEIGVEPIGLHGTGGAASR